MSDGEDTAQQQRGLAERHEGRDVGRARGLAGGLRVLAGLLSADRALTVCARRRAMWQATAYTHSRNPSHRQLRVRKAERRVSLARVANVGLWGKALIA